MKKTDWKYVVDTLLFLCMFGISFIGILMGFFLPKGPTVRESEKYLLGLHRHQWGDIHLYLSLAFLVLLILHLILAWNWIKGKSKSLFKGSWRTVLTLIVIAGFMVVVLFWLFTPKNSGKYAGYGSGFRGTVREAVSPEDYLDKEGDWVTITGQLTLQDIQQITGVSPEQIIAAIGLPARVPHDETLGQLRKKYGITIVEFREALTDLMNPIGTPAALKEPQIEKARQAPAAPPSRVHERAEEEHEDKLIRGRLAEDTSGILITGQMTFRDLERQTGIAARVLADKLGLPRYAALDEHLGRLRRRFGFSMQDVRDVITALLENE